MSSVFYVKALLCLRHAMFRFFMYSICLIYHLCFLYVGFVIPILCLGFVVPSVFLSRVCDIIDNFRSCFLKFL